MECSDKEWQHCRVEKMGCEGCIYNEKTADEMFEELGYEKIYEDNNAKSEMLFIEYTNKEKKIRFWGDRTVSKHHYQQMYYITSQELQAIYEKCGELGWIKK